MTHFPASPGPRVAGRRTIARIRGVRVRRGSAALVDDVNFDLRAGERLGVLGGRASGTSALGRALAGQSAHGETFAGGTVESGGEISRIAGLRWAHAARFSPTTGKLDLEDLSRALARGAGAVLLDQTSTPGVDPAVLLSVLADHDAPLVLVTDDAGLLRDTCDTVQVLLAGRIVERGPAEELLSRPRHRYLESLLAGAPEWVAGPRGGCAFEPRCPVGHGRPECAAEFPASRSYPSPSGAVTVKCHRPAAVTARSAVLGHADKEHLR